MRTLCLDRDGGILVGTTGNRIVKSDLLSGSSDVEWAPLVSGHTGELWALCSHPNKNWFVSAGFDKRVYLWNATNHSVIWSQELEESVQSACFSPDGNIIILGTLTGKWIAVQAETCCILATFKNGHEPIQVNLKSD